MSPGVDFDPKLPSVIQDPYPLLHALMEQDPVHYSRRLGGWVLTRYEHVRNGLRDPRLSADRIRPFIEHLPPAERARLEGLGHHLGLWAVFNDPPKHTRLRGLMNKAFTSRAIASLAPRVGEIVDELLDGLMDREEADILAEFAYPLPATVIAEMLGVPRSDVHLLKKWSDELKSFVGGARATPDKYDRAAQGIAEMTDYFARFIEERRRRPGEDVTSALLAAETRGDFLSVDELVATCVLLLFAGHETTTNLIANGLLALMRHPDQFEALRRGLQDAALVESAVEEMLRYDGPSLSSVRVVAEDFELEGARLRQGERVFLMNAAANRDPRVFPEPDRFDIRRPDNRHLTFGFGLHFCVGAPLARLEGAVAFPRLLSRFRDFELAVAEPNWSDDIIFRAMTALPVRYRAAAGASVTG
ncbi:MAG: cytochrome P450 [Alphaproteobacteria bacterium]|nr:cytochrome P450 [Alphaproteobacteria bacterium]